VRVLNVNDAAKFVGDELGIELKSEILADLSLCGHGPTFIESPLSPRFRTDDLARWLAYAFPATECAYLENIEADEVRPTTVNPGPTFLIVSDPSPDAEYMRRQLIAFGANVIGPVYSPRTALRVVARGDFDAALLEMDEWIPAAAATARVLTERKIPYAYMTMLRDVPRIIANGGVEIRVPWSLEEVAYAIERKMPSALISRMEMTKLIPIDDDADWIEPPAHPGTKDCWYFEKHDDHPDIDGHRHAGRGYAATLPELDGLQRRGDEQQRYAAARR
jgi:hypothetical protein